MQHTSGTLTLSFYDNVGNKGTASIPVSDKPLHADPYEVTLGPAAPLSTGGTRIFGMRGDDLIFTNLSLGFSFYFYEQLVPAVTVSTNGALYFHPSPTSPDALSLPAALDGSAMIAGLWDDLRTDRRPDDGIYLVQPDASRCILRWQAVTYDTPLGPGVTRGEHPVSFEVELRRDGVITVRYGEGNTNLLPVVGLSAGGPDAYVVASHTSPTALRALTNAQTVVFTPRVLNAPPATIRGRVTDGTSGLSGVTMTLMGDNTVATTTTDASGNYSFPNVRVGPDYTVAPRRTNYTFSPGTRNFNYFAGDEVADFTGTVQRFNITGSAIYNFSVLINGATITLSGGESRVTQTISNSFAFNDLPADRSYTLTASHPNYTFPPTPIVIANLSRDERVFFQASGKHVITGRVTDAGGRGLGNTTMILSGAQSGTRTTRTDAAGNYSFIYVPEASFKITPVKNGYAFNPGTTTLQGNPLVLNEQRADFTGAQTNAVSTVQFKAAGFSAEEGAGQATITVTRAGDTSGGAAITYATVDDPAEVRCDTAGGTAYARCDYATSVDTLFFSAGETEKTFIIPLVDDAHVEGAEVMQLRLTDPIGGTLGATGTATLTINDNDSAGAPNPIFASPFFVRQQYLDFLSREPDAGGFSAWLNVLDTCSDVNNNPACDRLLVSSSFFGSQEFQLKGFYVFRFYRAAFGRLPTYAEVVADMRSVTGTTSDEVFAKKADFANAFTQRPEFTSLYSGMTNAQYVAALLGRYGLTQVTTPDPANPDGTIKFTMNSADFVIRLDNRTITRAQVLRAIADSDQVSAAEYSGAFVAMQYYGYLRRTPEPGGYQAWLTYLNANPADFRTMVNGFMNSQEYKLRFGPPL